MTETYQKKLFFNASIEFIIEPKDEKSYGMYWYVVSTVLKRTSRIGLMIAKVTRLRRAERTFITILRARYFLYGGKNRLSAMRKSFIRGKIIMLYKVTE